jgi:hypothetical protein
MKSAPALGADGTIYLGASKGSKSSTFYALDPDDGSVLWQHQNVDKGSYNNNQAVVGADGTVYVTHGRFVYAFDGDGDGAGGSVVRWLALVKGKLKSGPILGGDGVLYVAGGKRLFKFTD